MKKIAIFQSDFQVGGIQKSLINLLNDLDMDKCRVDLYLFDEGSFFDMPEYPGLEIIRLKPFSKINKVLPFEFLLKHYPIQVKDEDYDVAIDFNSYWNECAVGAICASAKKRVMWIHNDVEIKLENEPKYKILWHFFKGKFQYFDEFCAVSEGVIDGFRRLSGVGDKPITAIPNHIDTREIFRKMDQPVDFSPEYMDYNLCTMGRICHQKGFDILLGYFARAAKLRSNLRLYIIGDGPDRKKMEALAKKLGVAEKVFFLGNQPNPFPYLAKMDAFTLTSRYEGQGMVIWEAKAVGLPLFISKNLEKYNPGIEGTRDLVDTFAAAEREIHTRDSLTEYNQEISESIRKVLELE